METHFPHYSRYCLRVSWEAVCGELVEIILVLSKLHYDAITTSTRHHAGSWATKPGSC